MQFNLITDFNLEHKRVFVRTDMNVPLQADGQIADDTRIMAGLDTIKYALKRRAQVIVATHLGRPQEGQCTQANSTKIIATKLTQLLKQTVPVVGDISKPIDFSQGNLVMLDNVRCNLGEAVNSRQLGQTYANLCDIFVHDAFATAHRKEASTDAIGYAAKQVCAGLLMQRELTALSQIMDMPVKPIVAIIGGSKVSTKLAILEHLAEKVDYLIVGGGILNTFLLASGANIGNSLVERNLVTQAKQIMEKMTARGATVPLPKEVVTAKALTLNSVPTTKSTTAIMSDEMILDISSQFAKQLATIIVASGTVIWNGPLGAFETPQFALGTKAIAKSIADHSGFSLAGGGDTIAALNQFGLINQISYVSTAGGALLEFLEGKELPAIRLLSTRYNPSV